jgi:hypothetical protein
MNLAPSAMGHASRAKTNIAMNLKANLNVTTYAPYAKRAINAEKK